MRRIVFLAPLALLYGCFGEPCGGADFGTSNASYAGAYSATFTGPQTLDFDVTVDEQGQIVGFVQDPVTQLPVEVSGTLYDFYFACSSEKSFCSLSFRFSDGVIRTIDGTRSLGRTQPWPFAAVYVHGNERVGSGTLTLVYAGTGTEP